MRFDSSIPVTPGWTESKPSNPTAAAAPGGAWLASAGPDKTDGPASCRAVAVTGGHQSRQSEGLDA